MGGGTFAQAAAPGAPTLYTPRMTPDEYTKIKSRWLARLSEYLGPDVAVGCAVEAPEKTDFGDVDLFAAVPDRPIDMISMAKSTGAAGVIVQSKLTCSLAVSKDDSDGIAQRGEQQATIVYTVMTTPADPPASVTAKEYAHIDLDIIEPDILPWWMFYRSYGDMMVLLGRMVSSFGFRVTNEGLWLRMKELDRAKALSIPGIPDKDGRLFLTKDPEQVMVFLGLSPERYRKGFSSLVQLFEWLGTCRLLVPQAFKVGEDNPHERQRLQKRKVYTKFFYEWLPAYMDMKDGDNAEKGDLNLRDMRDISATEAIEFFKATPKYEAKRTALVAAIGNAQAGELIKNLLAQHSERSGRSLAEVAIAFRRWVGCGQDGSPYILSEPHTDVESVLHCFLADEGSTLRDVDGMSWWVKDNWEAIRRAEKQRASKNAVDL